jgi:hypothetical protein
MDSSDLVRRSAQSPNLRACDKCRQTACATDGMVSTSASHITVLMHESPFFALLAYAVSRPKMEGFYCRTVASVFGHDIHL